MAERALYCYRRDAPGREHEAKLSMSFLWIVFAFIVAWGGAALIR